MAKHTGRLLGLLIPQMILQAWLVPPPALAAASQEPLLSGRSCQIWSDPQGITHARAADLLTVFGCWGFTHGRDRAWQMDFLRRIAYGRKAEILGISEIRNDFTMRLLGFPEIAQRIFTELSPDARERLAAYSEGVNRGFAAAFARGRPYEFARLNYRPEPWKPVDSIALILLQSFDQSKKTFQTPLKEQKRLERYGDLTPRLFNESHLPWHTTILKSSEYPAYSRSSAKSEAPAKSHPAPSPGGGFLPLSEQSQEHGSNNWVIAPSRSTTGKAWLANDPHLDLKTPAFWYLIHLEGGALNAIGASVPGVPFIASGSNQHVAWGLTNSYLDTAQVIYVPGKDLDHLSTKFPLIWFKWLGIRVPFFFKSFQRTEQGWPILPIEGPSDKALVLRWSGFLLGAKELEGFLSLNLSNSAREADRALSKIGVPSWNFVFADTRGEIGYRAVGLAIRSERAVPFGVPSVAPGGKPEQLQDFPILSPEQMPHSYQPKRGFIATANNPPWPGDSRFQEGHAFSNGFRAFRIEELLTRAKKHDLESSRRIQCDTQAVDARFLLKPMLELLDSSATDLGPRERSAIAVLKSWDLDTNTECRPCGIYRRWMDEIFQRTSLNEAGLSNALRDSSLVPDLRQILLSSFGKALADQGFPETKPWAEIHRNFFRHMDEKDFPRRQSIATPGDDQSVSPGTGTWNDGIFEHTSGASLRLIVEMTEPPTLHFSFPGTGPDIDDPPLEQEESPWRKWARCKYERVQFPLNWTRITTETENILFQDELPHPKE